MKKRQTGIVILALLVTFAVTGCSVFISTPRVARYHVQGLDDQMDEFVVPLDQAACNGNMDIQLTDRYAVQFDFEWLWNTASEFSDAYVSSDNLSGPSLEPWMICKYRF